MFICGTYIRKGQTTMGYACIESQLDKANAEIARFRAYIDLLGRTVKAVAKPTSTKGERD
jgi:hypothetical protein